MRYENDRFTFDEFIAKLQSRPTDSGTYRSRQLPDAIEKALYGWPEGRERMRNAIAQIEAPGQDTEAMTYDVAGNEPDIGRYLTGDPENMLAFQPTPDRKTIRIVADVALSGACIDSVVFMRGAALVVLIEQLERQGHRVDLAVLSTFEMHADRPTRQGKTYVAYVAAKPPGQPADMDRLAYLLGNYETERILMFETYEAFYGTFHSCSPGMIAEEDRGDIYLPGGHTGHEHWQSPEAARAWIDENLCRFTLETETA